MTSRDPAQLPGARFVTDVLGTGPEQLALRHTPDDPRRPVARAVAAAAREVDGLHQSLIGRAADAIRALEPVVRGEDPDLPLASGVLGTAAHDIDLLAARRGAAHQHLARLVTAYQQLSTDPAATTMPVRLGRRHGEAADVDEEVRALRAVERGGLRWKQSTLSPADRYLTDGTGVLPPAHAAAVERLIADGLLTIDTGTTPAQSQLLSLAPAGRDALHTADSATAGAPRGSDVAADPRATAAVTRSPTSGHSPPAPGIPAPGRPRACLFGGLIG